MRLRDISLKVIWEKQRTSTFSHHRRVKRLNSIPLCYLGPILTRPQPEDGASFLSPIRRKGIGSTMETIYTFFLNYEQYIILLIICFFAGMAWRHHRLISRLFIIAASCLWVIYVYRYQIAVGWPALDASGELSLRELLSDGAFIRHWSSLLSAAALGGALGVAFL